MWPCLGALTGLVEAKERHAHANRGFGSTYPYLGLRGGCGLQYLGHRTLGLPPVPFVPMFGPNGTVRYLTDLEALFAGKRSS